MGDTQDEAGRIAHLVRRAGFGATPDELAHYTKLGLAATVDELLEYQRKPDPVEDFLRQLDGTLLDLSTLAGLQTWWIYRMLRTARPMQEKMTLFWHGHFATSDYKVRNAEYMRRQNELLRAHALGNFGDLVKAISKDAAMLIWLDGNGSKKSAPNENYGRELLELFTMGIGNYTEEDVRAAARAFTGWAVKRNGEVIFNKIQHDDGEKAFLGQTGAFDGDGIVDVIMQQPATAHFIARKLFAFFAYDDPEPALVERLAATFREANMEVKPLVRAIFTAPEFYSPRAMQEHARSPVEFVIGSVRALGSNAGAQVLAQALKQLGQELFNPPNVAGWRGGAAWINPGTVLSRANFAARLTAARGAGEGGGTGKIDPLGLVPAQEATTWEHITSYLARALLPLPPTATTRAALARYTAASKLPTADDDRKLRGLLHLLLAAPESQLG